MMNLTHCQCWAQVEIQSLYLFQMLIFPYRYLIFTNIIITYCLGPGLLAILYFSSSSSSSFSSFSFFAARLVFPLPPLFAPGSPRMGCSKQG